MSIKDLEQEDKLIHIKKISPFELSFKIAEFNNKFFLNVIYDDCIVFNISYNSLMRLSQAIAFIYNAVKEENMLIVSKDNCYTLIDKGMITKNKKFLSNVVFEEEETKIENYDC